MTSKLLKLALVALFCALIAPSALAQGSTGPMGFPQDYPTNVDANASILTLGAPASGTFPNYRIPSFNASRFSTVDNGPASTFGIDINNIDLAHGGTGGTSQQSALNNVMPAGTAAASMVYFDGTNWSRLAPGSANAHLAMNATGNGLVWTADGTVVNANAHFYLGASDATMPNATVLSNGTGIAAITYNAGGTTTIGVDTTVVDTTTNSISLSNKTLVSPVFAWNTGAGVTLNGSTFHVNLKWADFTVNNSGSINFPDVAGAAANVIYDATAQTISGVKTFSAAPVISTITNTGTLTLPTSTDTLVGRATTDTLTNKTATALQLSNNSPALTFLQTSGNYIINAANPAATRTYSWYDANGNGNIAIEGATTTAGSVAYFDGHMIQSTGAGSSGQVLTSNGSSAPSWANASGGLDARMMYWRSGPGTENATIISADFDPTGLAVYSAGTNTSGTNSTNGRIVNAVTTTTSGNAAGVKANNFAETQPQLAPIFRARIVTPGTLTNVRIIVGLVSSDASTGFNSGRAYSVVEFDTGQNATNFAYLTNFSGGGASPSNSAVTVAAGTGYDIVVDLSTSGHVIYSIYNMSGTLLDSFNTTTGVPSATQPLGREVSVTTLTAAAQQVGIGVITMQSL